MLGTEAVVCANGDCGICTVCTEDGCAERMSASVSRVSERGPISSCLCCVTPLPSHNSSTERTGEVLYMLDTVLVESNGVNATKLNVRFLTLKLPPLEYYRSHSA